MLHHLLEAGNLSHKDVRTLAGSLGIASEFSMERESISKAQAKRLAEFFHLSAELFIWTVRVSTGGEANETAGESTGIT